MILDMTVNLIYWSNLDEFYKYYVFIYIFSHIFADLLFDA